MEGYVEKKDHKQEIVGELGVTAEISGDVNVSIQRRLVTSREDLENIKAVAEAVTSAAKSTNETDDVLKASLGLVNKPETVIKNVDTLIFF